MEIEYSTNEKDVRFIVFDENGEAIKSGIFTEDYNGPEKTAYLAWVAEGNKAKIYNPFIKQLKESED
jgi:hypothetical protein